MTVTSLSTRQRLWDQQQVPYTTLLNMGARDFFASMNPQKRFELFDNDNRAACCGDDRLTVKARKRLPGAGVMNKDPGSVVQQMFDRNIGTIITHDGCAAARNAGVDPFTWGQQVRTASRDRINHTHITRDKMIDPVFHPGTVIYVSALNRFGRGSSDELPFGYHMQVKDLPAHQVDLDLNLYLSVAMNSTIGMGPFFTPRTPLIILFLGHGVSKKPQRKSEKWRSQLSQMIDGTRSWLDRIHVDAVDAPLHWLTAPPIPRFN